VYSDVQREYTNFYYKCFEGWTEIARVDIEGRREKQKWTLPEWTMRK